MSIKKHKGAKGKCDALFSKIIRNTGICQRCGSREWLQTSHIVSRRYSATRTDLKNAQCLCAKCHRFFTAHPVEFGRWIFTSVGEREYDDLKRKSETVTKMDWDEELLRLADIYNNLQTDWITD
jgi:5-methylcytosine-specific restriction endonuclease McrA